MSSERSRPLTIAQHYHERTKYDPDTLAARARELDWSAQPVPYKTYKIGATYELLPYLQKEPPADDADWDRWRRLSLLLLSSYGVTARLQTTVGDSVYLRAAPSAGGLYPAEVYLVVRGLAFMPPGLYNYQSQTHSLVHFWDETVWPQLQAACFWHRIVEQTQLALVITGVFWRSAWRYEDRAYRRIFLDTGHLIGNLELAGNLADYRPHLIGGFNDRLADELLFLDREREGTLAIVPLGDRLQIAQNLPPRQLTVLPSGIETRYPDLADGELLDYLHRQTCIETEPTTEETERALQATASERDKYNFPFCLKVSTVAEPIDWGENLEALQKTMLRRRSTRAYSGENLTFVELAQLLNFTYQPESYLYQSIDTAPDFFDLRLVSTFVAVSGVDDLEVGCYYYAPDSQELRQIRFKNFREDLHFLCLGQDLGRDAAATIFHTADLGKAIAQYGDRAYRYLHLDAGHLGQRLNLAAIRLGLGVSGIAGFFDNRVNEVLGIPEDEAVLYLTTLGRPRWPARPSP